MPALAATCAGVTPAETKPWACQQFTSRNPHHRDTSTRLAHRGHHQHAVVVGVRTGSPSLSPISVPAHAMVSRPSNGRSMRKRSLLAPTACVTYSARWAPGSGCLHPGKNAWVRAAETVPASTRKCAH